MWFSVDTWVQFKFILLLSLFEGLSKEIYRGVEEEEEIVERKVLFLEIPEEEGDAIWKDFSGSRL